LYSAFAPGVTRVTLTWKAGAQVAVANGQVTALPGGRYRATYTRMELCTVVAALGGCPECYEHGKRTCAWRSLPVVDPREFICPKVDANAQTGVPVRVGA
jgi:hypothetical protein